MTQADIGLIGLAVMGQNLAMNIHDHGFKIAVFNRTVEKVDEFLQDAAKGTDIIGTHSLEEFCKSLKRPRRIMLMVKAGDPVDTFIEHLMPFLEPGDIIIDGGNSYFEDTERRCRELKAKGFFFVGAGISGGEVGARHGPSIMPGGHAEAWPHIKEIFQGISAKVNDNEPCCEWIGDGGAGHYVKMVHNGIEYGDMQLISEAYSMMKDGLKLSYDRMHDVFKQWNTGDLDSYLIEITADIMAFKDESGQPMVEKILDAAGQKGTGKWTGIEALHLGVPVTLIGEAVFARCLSALKDERVRASKILTGPKKEPLNNAEAFLDHLARALYASKIVSYAQGFMLIREAAKTHDWKIAYGALAAIWRGGCIIRSRFLNKITEAFQQSADLESLLVAPFFSQAVEQAQTGWRAVVAQAAMWGIPIPCHSTALCFYDGYRTAQLPANLLQAQRDYFGAHTYERIDKPRGQFFHTDWAGTGGKVSSNAYQI